ncbi:MULTISPECIES: WhiB family transcriptional regulator [Lentzea]|uniref:Transcriptional regulator WhiB n=1 Tax=Lentzea jiangxiensis TaxID=641025 RepID=A0A1H0RNF5_9PSEU|nr:MULTISPECIES: WhiB family transcriptional regulator [Lentzea]MCG8927787.1 WhiB family transcriptional regulator [Lentzea sp. CC55]WVH83691.1 WhiB family transcriptional regulator [Lentzea sp. DG1S-22]SDP31014.1 WhiB family transcriptional regulator, redox-sensing transcriptional regulator [Lentzea jiangxiensis]
MPELSRLPQPVTEAWDWQLSGLCRGMDSAYFFHTPNERGAAREKREAAAKAICHRCPVMEKCRAHALEVQETFGIWGGLGESELRAMLSRRLRQS